MRNNHFAEQNVTIDFPVEKVKEAINLVLQQKNTKYPHKKESLNNVMGTYQFFELGLNSIQFNLTIKPIDGGKTELSFRTTPDVTSQANSSMCAQSITTFQRHLTNALTGQPLAQSSGCLVLVVIGLVSIISLLVI